MWESGCAVTFTSKKSAVTHGSTTILTGQHDKESGMCRVPLGNTDSAQAAPEHCLHNVYEQKSIKDTITYLHACCFSPMQETWLEAIQNGHFATWPSVTVESVRKYLPKSDAMLKGHMNQIQHNISSTQPAVAKPTPESEMVQEDKCNSVYSALWKLTKSTHISQVDLPQLLSVGKSTS
jgi:hypothetical protein